jgi:hypothetical protein
MLAVFIDVNYSLCMHLALQGFRHMYHELDTIAEYVNIKHSTTKLHTLATPVLQDGPI